MLMSRWVTWLTLYEAYPPCDCYNHHYENLLSTQLYQPMPYRGLPIYRSFASKSYPRHNIQTGGNMRSVGNATRNVRVLEVYSVMYIRSVPYQSIYVVFSVTATEGCDFKYCGLSKQTYILFALRCLLDCQYYTDYLVRNIHNIPQRTVQV